MTRSLSQRLRDGFAATFGGRPDAVSRAPGRVNLIGEHTDYNDGFVLPAAIGVETRVAWRRTDARTLSVVALDFSAERDIVPLGQEPLRTEGWRVYVRAMLDRIQRAGITVPGLEIAIAGSIPRGSGLSSSAALEVALGHAMLSAAGLPIDRPALARMAQAAENDFVGMRCGIMDQLASAAGQRDAALLIDCRSLAIDPVPVPADWAVMIVQSGVVRGLVEGHYNRRRAECEQAAVAMGVASLRDVDPAALERARGSMPVAVHRRARHVLTENARTLAAADALRAAHITALGALMAASHASMRDDFEITVPPVDMLADMIGDALAGRGGARMTGGGFGGAVVAVMPRSETARVRQIVLERYRTPAGAPPDVMIERIASGVGLVETDTDVEGTTS